MCKHFIFSIISTGSISVSDSDISKIKNSTKQLQFMFLEMVIFGHQ